MSVIVLLECIEQSPDELILGMSNPLHSWVDSLKAYMSRQ